MGGGQVNPVSGDFMFRVQEAFEIKHGKIGTPLKNVTLTGNGPEMMKHITMMSGDPSFVPGNCGKNGQMVPVTSAIPTIRVEGLLVGGG